MVPASPPQALIPEHRNPARTEGPTPSLSRPSYLHWSEGGFNLVKATERLHVHRNTLLYHLGKIEQLSAWQMREPAQAIAMYLAAFAFGLSAGPAPDRFLVGLAVLGLLSEVAGECPLVCVVDDEQWLDRASAQALGFAARRLAADPVGLVFGARVPGEDVAGLPVLVVEGLDEDDARALLESALAWPLDSRVRDQIIADTNGKKPTARWPRPPTQPSIRTGGPGIGPRPLRDRTRTRPRNWNDRRGGRRLAGAWPQRPRSCIAQPC